MALPTTIVWEVNGSGNDANGGGFDSAGTGTDRSQGTSPFVTFDGVTITATTSGTSATITLTGYTVASADQGNVVKIASGTNFTAGYYLISSVNTGANTWTLDRNCTSGAGSGMVGRMGGAAATIGQITNSAGVSRNTVYVKAGSGYTITATINQPNSTALSIIGYSSSRGDGGTVSITCNTNSVSMVTVGVAAQQTCYRWKNFTFQHTAGTRGIGFTQNGAFSDFGPIFLENCTIDGCTEGIGAGTNNWTDVVLVNVVIKNCGTRGFGDSVKTVTAIDTLFLSNAEGVTFNNNRTQTYGSSVFIRCTFASNTGNGFKSTSNPNAHHYLFSNCSFYGNGTDGIQIDVSGVSLMLTVINSIFVSNSGYGINVVQSNGVDESSSLIQGNAYYNNSSGQVHNITNNLNAVTLSGDPFVNAGSQNFALDNTASEGAACRAASLPGAKRGGGTQYLDLGAFQHQEAAAGGMLVHPGMTGGMHG